MTIDVSTILKEIGGRIDIDGEVKLSDTDFLGEMYHFDEPVRIKGHISNNGKSLILKANCTGHMTTQCARCMKDIDVPVNFEIDENLVQDNGEVSDDDDAILFEDVRIDIDDIAANSFLMNVEGSICAVRTARVFARRAVLTLMKEIAAVVRIRLTQDGRRW